MGMPTLWRPSAWDPAHDDGLNWRNMPESQAATGGQGALVYEGFSRQQLVEQLLALGVSRSSVLVVHTSFRSVRPIEGGPEGLIEALRTALGPQGTLVMPTMTGSNQSKPYDPATTPTKNMGIVAETFWRMPGVLRSDHPTSSFAASGPHAQAIVSPQPIEPVHGLDSPIGRVYELDGDVLLLGVGHSENTMIHLAETLAGVPYRTTKWCTVLESGRPRRVTFREIDHCCRNFNLVDGWLREAGRQAEGQVGHAHAKLVRARDVVETVADRLKLNPLQFLCPRSANCNECNEAYANIASTS